MTRQIDCHSGMTEILHADADGRHFAIETRADVTSVLEQNQRRRASGDGYSPSRELRHVASIPPVVQLAWIQQFGADPLRPGNEDLLRRILNSSEWALLRTSEGRL